MLYYYHYISRIKWSKNVVDDIIYYNNFWDNNFFYF